MARLVDQLLDPLAIFWLTLVGVAAFHVWKRQIRLAVMTGTIVLMVFVMGSTPLAHDLLGTLERPYFRDPFQKIPVCDAVVVLGGAMEIHGGSEEPLGFDASESADRFLTGIDLIKRGKATNLVLGGGSFGSLQNKQSEAKALSIWVKSWQLTDAVIHQLDVCANTREEAIRVARIVKKFNWARLILVTSAAHMRRSEAVFRSSGLDVIPVACGFRGYPDHGSLAEGWRLLPSSDRFKLMRNYFHETVGWLYYRSRGWIIPGN